MIKCTKCHTEKTNESFYKDSRYYEDGRRSVCKACMDIAHNDRRRASPVEYAERALKAYRIRRYGVDRRTYQRILAEQGGVCSICGGDETATNRYGTRKKHLAVDHCHETGEVRGLLCQRCNTAIGMFNDDIDVLASAISYLRQSSLLKQKSA